jgi:hypothetical protein
MFWREFTLLITYGVCTMTGIFLTAFWARKAHCRILALAREDLSKDRYFQMSLAYTLTSIGDTIIYGSRCFDVYINGPPGFMAGYQFWMITIGLAFVILGMGAMVWLADLEHEGHPRWLWGMGTMTVLWTAVVCLHLF